jgi:hypothetical protein
MKKLNAVKHAYFYHAPEIPGDKFSSGAGILRFYFQYTFLSIIRQENFVWNDIPVKPLYNESKSNYASVPT